MRLLYLLPIGLFFTFFTETTVGQPRHSVDFDEFRSAIREAQSDDEKLESYISYAFTQFRNTPDSLFSIAREIDDLTEATTEKKEAYQNFVLAFAWRQSNSDSSLFYAERASEQLKELNSHVNYLRSKNLLGSEYARYGNTLDAENAFLKALEYQSKNEVSDYPEHFFYGNLGNIYSRVGAYDLAIEMYQHVLDNSDRPSDQCNILSTLSVNLSKLGDYNRAVEELSPCLENESLIPPIASIVRSNMSQIMLDSGDSESALEYLEQAAAISHQNRIPNLELAHQVRLGSLYLDLELTEKAKEIEDRLMEDRFSSDPPNNMIRKHLYLTRMSNLSGDFIRSIEHSNRAITLAERMNMNPLLDDVYTLRSEAFIGLNDLNKALNAANKQIELTLEISQREENREVANAKVRHQLIQYETELASSQSILNYISTQLGIVGGLFLLLSFGSGFLYYRYYNSKAERALAMKQLSESEIRRRDLEEAIKNQKKKLQKKDTKIFVHINSSLMLSVDDIRYIQSDGNYVRIHLADENKPPILERCTLKHCESILPDDYFRKIHRSTIVNLLHIVQVEGEHLTLKDGTRLKLARRARKEFLK